MGSGRGIYDRLDEETVCEKVGLKRSTWRVYVSTGKAPKPDGKLSLVRGPFWYRDTIDQWQAERKRKRKWDGKGEFAAVNREAYNAAAWNIERGKWHVYPENGIVDVGEGRISVIGGGSGYLCAAVGWMVDSIDGQRSWPETSTVLLHRVIWEHREWDNGNGQRLVIPDNLVIDHINRIPYDNRIANLREVTQRENLLNRKHLSTALGTEGAGDTVDVDTGAVEGV